VALKKEEKIKASYHYKVFWAIQNKKVSGEQGAHTSWMFSLTGSTAQSANPLANFKGRLRSFKY
jgi:hypothetical protein